MPSLLRIFGQRGSASAYMLRDFLHRCDVPFAYVQLTDDEQARAACGVSGLRDPRLPVCIFADGSRLECPTIRQVAEKLGWFHTPSSTEYDVAIYGAGPAGLSAAVYAASDGLRTVLIERWAIGGQAASSCRIENYLGFPQGISGNELADRAREQACKFGVEILIARRGIRAEFPTGKGVGYLEDGTKIVARASICATGVEYRQLQFPNAQQLTGAGLYYGAGASEAPLTAGEHVFILGGGNSAGQAALHFAPYAKRVTMVIRGNSLSAYVSKYLADRIQATPNIEIVTRTELAALDGVTTLERITLKHCDSGERQEFEAHWVFVCIGAEPNAAWAEEVGARRDAGGYLMTGPDLMHGGKLPEDWPLERVPYYLETNIPGVFAVGDVRHGSIKRFASAVGEGAMAVAFVHRHLADT
jgi:thioredoxin reductase (NADPH)